MNVSSLLYKTDMVRALLDGSKKLTRRIFMLPNDMAWYAELGGEDEGWFNGKSRGSGWWNVSELNVSPWGGVGDLIYVKETYSLPSLFDNSKPSEIDPRAAGVVRYLADGKRASGKTRPSIFMTRWASRITLEITSVRVERLQEITNDDAQAEGPPFACPHRHGAEGLAFEVSPGEIISDQYAKNHNTGINDCWVCAFRRLWQSIYLKQGYGWDKNPWVWVLGFAVHEINVDSYLKARAA